MARRFQIEHLAVKPRGYKVRTVIRGKHRIRVAFPPGARKKGSGIPLEVLHPLNENPGPGACRYSNPAELIVMANPAELVVMAGNPEAEAATRKFEEFHGLSSDYIDEHDEGQLRSRSLAELGNLLELRVKPDGVTQWGKLLLAKQKIKLASNAAGTQLYCVGGDQSMTRAQLSMLGADPSKDVIDLGEVRYVAYRTRKAMVGGNLASYEHALGEETQRFPRLNYDRRGSKPRLIFAGGEYRVEAPGIIN